LRLALPSQLSTGKRGGLDDLIWLPASANSIGNDGKGEAKFLCPILKALSLPLVSEQLRGACVPRLLCGRRPDAGFWAVEQSIAFGVLVKRHPLGAFSHVLEKVDKRTTLAGIPTGANANSSSAVVGIGRVTGGVTACQHRLPTAVRRRSLASVRVTVLTLHRGLAWHVSRLLAAI